MSTQRFTKVIPDFFLAKNVANNRITKFMANKHPLLSGAMDGTDTKSIWYSFQHIENLYKELVFLNADGLRIYFGEYEEDHEEFRDQLCIVMVPTRANDEDPVGHEDVIMEDDEDFAQRPGSDIFLEDEQPKAFNYGSPCPSLCPRSFESKYPFPISDDYSI